jgi:hypothetical protein
MRLLHCPQIETPRSIPMQRVVLSTEPCPFMFVHERVPTRTVFHRPTLVAKLFVSRLAFEQVLPAVLPHSLYSSARRCQLNGSQPDMITIYCGHDFFEYSILYYITFS